MGPSGSGKTTLLSILGLVLTPTEGEVLVGGNAVSAASADELAVLRRDQLGFVFQQFNLLPSLSALENAAVPLLLAGVRASERTARAMRALELVGIADKRSATPRRSRADSSSASRSRARWSTTPRSSCATSPRPRSTASRARDPRGAARARQGGRAVVIVTHDDRVLSIADRLVHVVDGKVVPDDDEAARSRPAAAAAAGSTEETFGGRHEDGMHAHATRRSGPCSDGFGLRTSREARGRTARPPGHGVHRAPGAPRPSSAPAPAIPSGPRRRARDC